MTNSILLTPTVTVATVYFVNTAQVALRYSQAQQPLCQLSGVDQTATPEPSPSR